MNNLKFGYLFLGALFGVSMAMMASRKKLAYAVQSGEGAGSSGRKIMKHDKKIFRNELEAARQ